MKKSISIILVFAVLCGIVGWAVGKYNDLVVKEEAVATQWGAVESSYQRRADLIPNIVQTVKGYAKHEESTLEGVVEARAKATSINVDPNNLTPEALEAFQSAQNGVSGALGRLMMVKEAYPELKADKMFINLQDELAGTENRIKLARDQFNETAQQYNVVVRKFPTNIIASIFGFQIKPYFKADEEAKNSPKVSFD